MDDWRRKIKYQTKCNNCNTEIRFAECHICYGIVTIDLKCPACGNFTKLTDNNWKNI